MLSVPLISLLVALLSVLEGTSLLIIGIIFIVMAVSRVNLMFGSLMVGCNSASCTASRMVGVLPLSGGIRQTVRALATDRVCIDHLHDIGYISGVL